MSFFRKHIYIILTFAISQYAYNQTDDEFWFVAPEVSKDHSGTGAHQGGRPAFFVFTTTDIHAYVTVQQPANNQWLDTTIYVPAFSVVKWDMTHRMGPANAVDGNNNMIENIYNPSYNSGFPYNNRGFKIRSRKVITGLDSATSRSPITVYYESSNKNNTDIFALKGRNALGSEFFTSFQNSYYNRNNNFTVPTYSSFDIVFTEDNTYITLEIPAGKEIYNGTATPWTGTVTLGPFNTGETFMGAPARYPNGVSSSPADGWKASDTRFARHQSDHLNGIKIIAHNQTKTSKRKIAVTLKDDSMKSLLGGCYDLGGDQTIPVELTGTEYIAMRGQLSSSGGTYQERLYIMPINNNTTLQINGNPAGGTLNAGQSYMYAIPNTEDFTYVKSSDSVYVLQVSGFGCEMGMAVLPSVSSCTGSTDVGFTRSTNEGFFFNVMVRNNAKTTFIVNGNPQTLATDPLHFSKFTDIAGTDWSAARIDCGNSGSGCATSLFGVNKQSNIQNTEDVFHLGVINGGPSSGTRYGYFSNYNAVKPEAFISESGSNDIRICFGESAQIVASGGVFYSWNPATYLSDPLDDKPIASPPITTNYTATVKGYCGVKDSTSITITVGQPLKADYSIDTTFGCSPINLKIRDRSYGVSQYRWTFDDGSASQTWNVASPDLIPNDSTFYHLYTNNDGTTNPDTFKTFDLRLIAVGINNQCKDTLDRSIIVYPKVNVSYTSNLNNVCDSSVISFSESTTNEHFYQWDFGDGASSADANPSHLYRNYTNGSVVYKSKLKAISKYYCEDSTNLDITVHPLIDAEFVVDTSQGCNGLLPKFLNTSRGPIDNYDIEFGDIPGTSNIDNITLSNLFANKSYSNTGANSIVHTVKLYARNSGGCQDSFKKNITVFPQVIAGFSNVSDTAGCSPWLVNFTPLSNNATVQYLWEYGDGKSSLQNSNSTVSNTYQNSLNISRNYIAKLKVTSVDNCTATAETTVTAYSKVDASFALDITESCDSLKPLITNNSFFNSSNDVLVWDFGDGSPTSNSQAVNIPHKYSENLTNSPFQRVLSLSVTNPQGCNDTYLDTITLYPDIVPGFNINNASGCNPLPVTFTNTTNHSADQNYFWSFGNGSSSTSQNPGNTYSHIQPTNQIYKVMLTVSSKNYPCVDTVSKTITVFPYLDANFTLNKSGGCSPLDIEATNNSQGGIESYNWDFGDTSTYPTTSDPGLKTYINKRDQADSITRNLKLVISNTGGLCKDSIERIITVYPEVVANFSIPDNAGCVPHLAQFNNLSNKAASRFNWFFGDGPASSIDVSPSYTYEHLLNKDRKYGVSLEAFSKYNCKATHRDTVTAYSYINADFKIALSTLCTYTPAVFSNTSIGWNDNIKQNRWDFRYNGGTGNFSTINDLSIDTTYTNSGNQDSTYWVLLEVENDKGCIDTFSRYVVIHPQVISSFTPNTPQSSCQPDTVEFMATVNSNVVTYYNWDFDDGSTSGSLSPTHIFSNFSDNDTTYNVRLIAQSKQGCTDQANVPVTVYAYIDANFKVPNATICPSDSIRFENASLGGVQKSYWYFGDNTEDSTDFANSTFHRYTNNTSTDQDFPVRLVVRNKHFECTKEYRDTVTIYPNVIVDGLFSANVPEGCQPHTTGFSNTTDTRGATSWNWDFGDGSTSSEKEPSRHTFVNLASTDKTFNVKLTAKSITQCTDVATIPVTAYAFIDADFKVDTSEICSGFSIPVRYNSPPGATSRFWDFDGDNVYSNTNNNSTFRLPYYNFNTLGKDSTFLLGLRVTNNQGCSDTATTHITIHPKVVADFSRSTFEGCNPLEINFTDQSINAATLNWDFGDGTSSSLNTPVHRFSHFESTDKIFNVRLHSVSQYNCEADTTYPITVYPYILADFKLPVGSICSHDSFPLQNVSKGGIVNYNWNFNNEETRNIAAKTSFNHAFQNFLATPSLRTVRLIVNNHDPLCTDTVERQIEIFPKVTADFKGDLSGCHPFTTVLSNNSVNGTDLNWYFPDNSTDSRDIISRKFYNFTDTDKLNQPIELVVFSDYGCADSITRLLSVNHLPKSKIEVDNYLECQPFNAVFINNSITSKSEFQWDFGDPGSGGENQTANNSKINVSHRYFNTSGTQIKSFLTTLKATTDSGCIDEDTLRIYVYPQVYARFDSIAPACNPYDVQLTNHSINGFEYFWKLGDSITSNRFTPSHIFYNPTEDSLDINVELVVTSQYECKDSTSRIVRVYPSPAAFFTVNPTIQYFPESTFTFSNQTNNGKYQYRWDFDDGSPLLDVRDPNTYTYKHWAKKDKKYKFTVGYKVFNQYCGDSAFADITLLPPIPTTSFGPDSAGCSPFTVRFENQSIWGDTSLWEFDDGTTSLTYNPIHTFISPGIYNVKLTTIGEGGQTYQYRTVQVYAKPEVKFSVEPRLVMLPDDQIKCFNLTVNGKNYDWDFGDGSKSTKVDPLHKYTALGEYSIKLVARSENSCVDSFTMDKAVIVAGKGKIVFPNAFTPNLKGPNGGVYDVNVKNNDIFYPYYEGVAEYNLEIYNRWGELLFVSNSVLIGWDGYFNGKLCKQDVYVYKATGKFYNGKAFERSGDITLLHKDN